MSAARSRVAIAVIVAIAGAIAWLAHAIGSPESTLLRPEAGAVWIKAEAPSVARHRIGSEGVVRFRRRFDLSAIPDDAWLSLRAFRTHRVLVNGSEVGARPDPAAWNRSERLDLSPALRVGSNELIFEVDNPRGPPALLAFSPGLGIASDGRWTTSREGQAWRLAALASERAPLSVSSEFPSAARSFVDALPLLLALFAVGALAARRAALRPVQVRWLLLGAWTLLCARNIATLPPGIGFDVHHHLAYIVYLAKTGRVPLATDGWQMFQSPLFYLLATPIYAALEGRLTLNELLVVLRVIPMLCGLGQIELAYRAARLLFPGRRELQIVGVVAGGLLPINLYSAQVVSNEPLAGALTALVVVHAFKLLTDPGIDSPLAHATALGAGFGLALLAKVSAILLLPLLVAVLVHHVRARGAGVVAAASLVSAFSFTATAIAGWYYLRNWLELGRPFVGGWDPARGIVWWQDPGYRVPEDFFRFGAALTRPVYASISGFWDGLYSTLWLDGFMSGIAIASSAPPWRSELVLAMPLLSLPLSLALAVGALRCWRSAPGPARAAGRFAVACIAVHWIAMAGVFLAVPFYSSIKATYSLGVLPCYAVVIARGFEPMVVRRPTWMLAAGVLASWAGASFLGYLT